MTGTDWRDAVDPIVHTTCGTGCEPRWVLDDVGEECIVAWCPTCAGPPPTAELSRAIAVTDVGRHLLQVSPRITGVQ